MNNQDLIAVPLEEVCGAIVDQKLSALCECIKDYAQQAGSMPCNSYPFRYTGGIGQSINTFTLVDIFQVPPGQVGTITQITFAERTPGGFYGANFTLIVNGMFHPAFSKIDHPIGTGMEHGIGTRICLEEQDTVSILIECWWTPIVFTGIATTFIQHLWPFEISGYFTENALSS
mgnify:CR=1 FL=1